MYKHPFVTTNYSIGPVSWFMPYSVRSVPQHSRKNFQYADQDLQFQVGGVA